MNTAKNERGGTAKNMAGGPDLRRFGFYAPALVAAWSAVVFGLLALDIFEERAQVDVYARQEALATFNKDLSYRRWASEHGGVYVPVTDKTPPNPHLAGVPGRDIITVSGKRLTLVNPSYMTRQVYESSNSLYGIKGRITSLKPLRPENAPDHWEAEALRSLENGEPERYGRVELAGRPYLRFMRPMMVEKSCLKCHGAQGYKEGQVRGGISVSVPLDGYLASAHHNSLIHILGYGLLWGLGVTGLGLAVRDQRRQLEAVAAAHAGLLSERDEKLTAEEALRASEAKYRNIFENIQEILYRADLEGRITDISPSISRYSGYAREELIGRKIAELYADPGERRRLVSMLLARGSVENFGVRLRRRDGSVADAEVSSHLLLDPAGRPSGVEGILRDVSARVRAERDLKAGLAEKELLLREIHHRVKNNLQVVSSLLSLQAKRVTDPAALEAFSESRARVGAMALVHETLYRTSDFSNLDLREYVGRLAEAVLAANKAAGRVAFSAEIAPRAVSPDTAVSLGLIINELLSNSFKHAFAGGRSGKLSLRAGDGAGGYYLEVEDDGPGLPAGFDPLKGETLGIQLVHTLSRQIEGRLEILPGKGARLRIWLSS